MRGHEVIPNLYIMGMPRVKDVETLGITAILDVAKKKTDPDVVATVKRYAYLHLVDSLSSPVDVNGFGKAHDLVCEWLKAGDRVLVHCLAGRNRSALVAALVARTQLGLSGPEALKLIRERRPRALWNDNFAQFLVELP